MSNHPRVPSTYHHGTTIPCAPKFFRRHDLTPHTRFSIAVTAFMAKSIGAWGTITHLSRQFLISRTFIYLLVFLLEEASPHIFGPPVSPPALIEKYLPYYYILSLRMEGRCSIEAISVIMKRFGLPDSSTGSISQFLTSIGLLLPDTLSTEENEVQLVVFVSDELFARSIPLLITVDPWSSAILRVELADTRKIEDWKRHGECLEKNGYCAVYLVSDEGRGLCSAQKEALVGIFRQPDTYHAIAHQLGQWVHILENAAYKAIEAEEECYRKLDSARSDAVIEKRIDAYEQARKCAEEKIELYDNFSLLYDCLIKELLICDTEGALRDRTHAEETLRAGLDLLETLGNPKITKAVRKVRSTLPNLLHYFDVAEDCLAQLQGLPIDQDALRALCCAWQWRKGRMKAKKPSLKNFCASQETFYLELAQEYLQDDFPVVKEHVYTQLDSIVQSSSMVECINSIIRPYLNTSKNHVTQETLTLIMFYHNHRRYSDGKRKGATPMELLTGKKQEKDWIELLFETVKKKDPLFLASPPSKYYS